MEKILSGKPLAKLIRSRVKELIAEHGLSPKMLLIQTGSDPASAYYVQNIVSSGAKLGCDVRLMNLPEDISQAYLQELIASANDDPDIHGIMLQKPLPHHLDEALAGENISPDKDIDCLNPVNQGRIVLNQDALPPCTPLAVLCTLRYYGIPVAGKHTVIIGRSAVVGKPLANMLLWKKSWANASVTVCHSRSENLGELTRSADILIAALGKAEFLKPDMIKNNSVLIDVGINAHNSADGKGSFVGDIDYNACFDKALAITPVPGGIGSVTTSLLWLNLLKAALAAKGTNKKIDDFLDFIFKD